MEKNKEEREYTLEDILSPVILQQLQECLSSVTGIRFCSVDMEGKLLTISEMSHDFCSKYTRGTDLGIARCTECDRKAGEQVRETEEPYLYQCYNGLWECVIPIIVNQEMLGYFVGGQILFDQPFTKEEVYQKAETFGIDPEVYYSASKDIPVFSKREMEMKLHTVYPMLNFIIQMAYEEYRLKVESEAYEREAKMKSDFLANMSHEIRTPMNAVIGMAEMALREDLPSNAREHIIQIQSAGQSLLAIINDILDFSKIESGKMDINMEDYEPLQLINDVANVIETRIGKKNVELLIDFDPDIPKYLMGDDTRIRQVIMNLANNAVKFTNEGKVTIKVGYTRSDSHMVMLRVSVADTGIGIKKEDMNKLFQSFQQVDSKRNRNVEGTGLGLAISKQLVTLMKGRISVQSEYNKGSVFSFEIPQIVLRDEGVSLRLTRKPESPVAVFTDNPYLMESMEKDFARIEIPMEKVFLIDQLSALVEKNIHFFFVDEPMYGEPVESFVKEHSEMTVVLMAGFRSARTSDIPNLVIIKKPIYIKPLIMILNGEHEHLQHVPKEDEVVDFIAPEAKVLLVDDNEVNLTVAEGLMEPLQMRVDSVLSGEDAIRKISEEHYDLIFMDHMMPVMDGVETTHIIRRFHPDYDDVPIIALTANAMEEAKSMFLVEGMNDFIAKPIEGKVLFSVIKQWLPKEKIHKTEPGAKAKKAEAVTAGSEKLQRLEATGALDVKYGMGIMGTEKLYWKVLRDYYDVIDTKAARLQEAFAGTDWSAYGIEAHALKSSSKMIGATDLSKLAETMEMAAKNGNVETIVEKHEELLRKYLWYKKALAHFVLEEEEKPEARKAWASVNDLREIFHTLKQAFDELDMDAMESVVEQLSKYRFNQDETELYEQLKEAISNLDVDSGELLLSQWELLLDEE